MAGHLDFGDNGYPQAVGVCHDVAHLLLSEVEGVCGLAIADFVVGECGGLCPVGAHLGQAGGNGASCTCMQGRAGEPSADFTTL